MIKKICIILAICLGIMGCREAKLKPAFAEPLNLSEVLEKIPALNQSILFNITDSELDYASSVTLVRLLNTISLDIGWSPKQQVLGLASIKLVEVKDYLDYPILRWIVIEPFVAYGFDRIENFKELGEGNLSVGTKLLEVKF